MQTSGGDASWPGLVSPELKDGAQYNCHLDFWGEGLLVAPQDLRRESHKAGTLTLKEGALPSWYEHLRGM